MRRFGIAVVAVALVPALLAAQADSSRMRDSSRRAGRQQQTSAGSIANNSMRTRLNHDQVTQLQTALQNMGCDPGSVDGVMGTHTRSAMSCARQKNNITVNDPRALYQSLNLNFSSSDTGATSNRGSITNGTTGTTGKAHTTHTRRMRGDSTHRTSTTRPDSTRRP
jgi:peptidoglycan hydrolase-like protein with peptidoglycan-binding domain